jgi:hypothetical protein
VAAGASRVDGSLLRRLRGCFFPPAKNYECQSNVERNDDPAACSECVHTATDAEDLVMFVPVLGHGQEGR